MLDDREADYVDIDPFSILESLETDYSDSDPLGVGGYEIDYADTDHFLDSDTLIHYFNRLVDLPELSSLSRNQKIALIGVLFKHVSASRQFTQLLYLSILQKKANQATQNKTATYAWWLRFNFQLFVSLLKDTGFDLHYHLENDDIVVPAELEEYLTDKYFSLFPDRILFPTFLGEMGKIAINRASPIGIHVIGIEFIPPFFDSGENVESFYNHDLGHANIIIETMGTKPLSEFHDHFIKLVRTLPLKQRKAMEDIYLDLTQENPIFFIDKSPQELEKSITENELLEKYNEPENKATFKSFIDLFVKIKKLMNLPI